MDLKESYIEFLKRIPGVSEPKKRLTFKEKSKWVFLVLLIYFLMSQITIYGISPATYQHFQYLELILGSKFGSIVTLGIGPIVTASIMLQLLVGSKIIDWDLKTEEGKTLFQGTQKFLAIVFSVLEAAAYVLFGAIPAASPDLAWLVILQLSFGGWIAIFLDELISKWGFGSGVSLFIVGGVAKTIVIKMFNPLTQSGLLPGPGAPPVGRIPYSIMTLLEGMPLQAFFALLPVIATFLVFVVVVYAQAIEVGIPLAFGNVRGFGRRWPLKFIYTSNIPVILVAALLGNFQILAKIMSDKGLTWMGRYDSQGNPIGGLVFYLQPPRTDSIAGFMIFMGLFALLGILVAYLTRKKAWQFSLIFAALGGVVWYSIISSLGLTGLMEISSTDLLRIFTYLSFMVVGSVIFSIFWVATSGMDARSVAEQIQSTGMQIPGYRRDVRTIENVLNRYIPGLTVLGGAFVGFLAAYADFTMALGSGMGILLAVMIIYQMYQELAMQHLEDMSPMIRRFLEK